MPSSTSSSKHRLLEVVLAVAVTGAVALAAEGLARAKRFSPQPNNDADLWSVERTKADAGKDVLAIAGSSRFQVGLDLAILRKRFPHKKIVQLAIAGGSPIAILNDLASDKKFVGAALCELIPHLTFTDVRMDETWPGYSARAFSANLESRMRAYVKARLAIFRPELEVPNIMTTVATARQFPTPAEIAVNEDRQMRIDFSVVDTVAAEKSLGEKYSTTGNALSAAQVKDRVAQMRRAVQTIRQRGGSVIFFQMPSSGLVRAAEERRFPEETYWNVFQAGIDTPAFRYSDVQTLAKFRCAEGAHLDQKDTSAFTEAFCDELIRRGVVD